MRRRAKVDSNQSDIVKALRGVGCSVQSLAAIGKGCPDLLVGRTGLNWLMEVKVGSRPPSERRLTPLEIKWAAEWGGEVHIVLSPAEALAIVGA